MIDAQQSRTEAPTRAIDAPSVTELTTPPVVQTWELSKRYGDFDALADCSVRVERETIFGLLGPNGAGKTTLLRLLLGYLQPTGGRCEVTGVDPVSDGVSVRRNVSYLPGDARLPRHMNGKGVLKFFADLRPDGDLARSYEVAERLDLDLTRRVAFMSTGMRQKLALAVVFGPRTPLLILDEPTANLDPTVRAAVLEMVMDAKRKGRTVVLSSHVLSEIEDTCDRVAFLRRGRLAHELTMADLFQRHRITGMVPSSEANGARVVSVPTVLEERATLRFLEPAESRCGEQRVQIDTAGDLGPLLNWLDSLQLRHLRIEPLGLRAVYDAVHFGEEVAV